jgi:hypothetical protein
MRMHNKPYTCDIEGCRRTAGFTTMNDLNRHKIAKHFNGMDPTGKTTSYRCASKDCRNPGKIWSRLDNFKAHIVKMHPNDDTQDIINRYGVRTLFSAYLTVSQVQD